MAPFDRSYMTSYYSISLPM